jgi:hypothetical protein
MSESRYWYPGPDGQPAGPDPVQAIRDRLAAGALRPTSPLCLEGTEEWRPASEFPELAGVQPATRYFFKRDGMKVGPHPTPELVAKLRQGELTASDEVMAVGGGTWVSISLIPSLRVEAIASGAPAPAAAILPAQTPRAPARPGGLQPVPYTPGAQPADLGPFLRYSCPPADLATHFDALAGFAPPPPPNPGARWKPRLWLCGAILLMAFVAVVADRAMGFPKSPFAFLLPLAAVGIVLVVAATGPPGLRPRWMREHSGLMGCFVLVLGLPMASAFSHYAWGDSLSVSPIAWIFGSFFALGLAVLIDNREGPPQSRRWDLGRVEDCKAVAEALLHDALPGKPAVGWIDLTGPRQEPKLFRRGTATSGRAIRLYRDEWWRLTLPLRDGNRLRISAVERVKVKAGLTRPKRSKPEVEERISTLEVKLGVNTAAYRTLPHFTPSVCGELQPGPIQTAPDSVSAAARLRGVTRFRPKDALTLLALVYARLEPVKGEARDKP